jgi:putative sigma-54 modulation protein
MKVDQIKIKSSAASENMYASIDKAVDRLQAQLRRYKRRIRDHQARGVSEIDMNVNVLQASDEVAEVNDDIDSENSERLRNVFVPHQIVSTETRALKTLTQSEAIMKMELSGDVFMIYRSEEDQKLKVIYRRNDGNFAVIEPEK